MKYNTINLSNETKFELDKIYYPLKMRKKIKSYDELIIKLINFRKKHENQ